MKDVVYGSEPVVTILADTPDGLERCRRAVAEVGARPGLTVGIAEGAALIDVVPRADAVLVDIAEDGGAALDRLLDRLNREAERGEQASVICLAPALIDVVAARADDAGVNLLCDVGEGERRAALAAALRARPLPAFYDPALDEDAPGGLRQLSEEVSRIARALARLSGEEEAAPAPGTAVELVAPARAALPHTETVRAMLRARRLREQYLDPDLFADPAWDMLLDLLLAHIERRSVAVSSLCIAAAVPPTTALRWIKRLTDEGLFVRTADPRDGRRVFIDLAPSAVEALSGYFRALEQAR